MSFSGETPQIAKAEDFVRAYLLGDVPFDAAYSPTYEAYLNTLGKPLAHAAAVRVCQRLGGVVVTGVDNVSNTVAVLPEHSPQITHWVAPEMVLAIPPGITSFAGNKILDPIGQGYAPRESLHANLPAISP